jgi:hypothetical protein
MNLAASPEMTKMPPIGKSSAFPIRLQATSRSAGLRLCPSYSDYGCAGLCNDADATPTYTWVPVGSPR